MDNTKISIESEGQAMTSSEVFYSKALSWLLRHGAKKEKVDITEDGYIFVNDVINFLNKKKKGFTLTKLKAIVEGNDKRRFSFSSDDKMIRANQGHSIPGVIVRMYKIRYKDVENYPIVVHGTSFASWKLIKESGHLNKMERHHIHFANGYNAKSGFRKNSQVLIEINLEQAIKDKIPFFVSENGVILTPGEDGKLDKKYFIRVMDKKHRELDF